MGYPRKIEKSIQHFPVAEPHAKIADAKSAQCIVHAAKDFDIGGKGGGADGIKIKLRKLAEPSRIRFVCPPDRTNLIASKRQGEIGILRDNTGEGDRQIEPERNLFILRILELEDLLCILFPISHQRHPIFQRRRIKGKEAVGLIDGADGGDELQPRIHLCRKIIPEPAQQSWLNNFIVRHISVGRGNSSRSRKPQIC